MFYLKDVVSKIDVAPNKVHVGVVKYASYPTTEFSLVQHQNRPSVRLLGTSFLQLLTSSVPSNSNNRGWTVTCSLVICDWIKEPKTGILYHC